MDHNQVMALLEANQNETNIEKWELQDSGTGKLQSFGIGLTILRKLAKQVGRDHALALELWESNIYDARIIALLIDDPKKITREQVEIQVESMRPGYLAHVFSSCDAALAKTPFVVDLLVEWKDSKDTMRRRCAYGLLYEVSKSKRKDAPTDEFFLKRIEDIKKSFHGERRVIQGAMGGALIGVGKRNAKLNASALKLARSIGPIEIASRGNDCQPLDVVKHLTSDYIRKKLGV